MPSTTVKEKFVINIVTGKGGGGHYATYHAIRAIARSQRLPWQFQVTDMDEIMARMTAEKEVWNVYKLLGSSPSNLYNLMLKNGFTWLWPLQMRLNKLLVKLNYDAGVRFFETYWRQQQPDIVLSMVTMCNKVLSESLSKVNPNTPYVTLPTDFADCPPGFWIEPETDNYTICATEQILEQARTLGVKEERIIKTSGLVIDPRFYQPITNSRRHQRQRLGLDPDCLTGVVSFGGNGSKVMLEIARHLECFGDKLQFIFLCGHNEELAMTLNSYRGSQKRFITTFTEDVPYYMQLADFFIGKPGNISVSEAMVMKLPVITECNSLTMVHERHCCELIADKELGVVISNFRTIEQAVSKLIKPENYARYQNNLNTFNNKAVFEIAGILPKILEQNYSNKVNSEC